MGDIDSLGRPDGPDSEISSAKHPEPILDSDGPRSSEGATEPKLSNVGRASSFIPWEK